MENLKGQENIIFKTATYIKDSSKRTSFMARGNTHRKMEHSFTKANLRTIRKTAMGFTTTQMALYMRVSGKMISSTGRANIKMLKMTFMKVFLFDELGEYKEGKRCGQGKCVYGSRDVYEGEWKDDVFNGKGKYMYWNDKIA